jgi:hypothetical protein
VRTAGGELAVAATSTPVPTCAEQELRHRHRGRELSDVRWPDQKVGVRYGAGRNRAGEELEDPAMADDLSGDKPVSGRHESFYGAES